MILSSVHWEARSGDRAQCRGCRDRRVMSLRWRLAAERLDGGCKRPRAALSRLHECVHVADAGRYAERAPGCHPGGSGALLPDAGHPDRRATRSADRIWRLRCCMVSKFCCCLYFQIARVLFKTNWWSVYQLCSRWELLNMCDFGGLHYNSVIALWTMLGLGLNLNPSLILLGSRFLRFI